VKRYGVPFLKGWGEVLDNPNGPRGTKNQKLKWGPKKKGIEINCGKG